MTHVVEMLNSKHTQELKDLDLELRSKKIRARAIPL
jgi:hypothetical protein